jgi:hypothetical protein
MCGVSLTREIERRRKWEFRGMRDGRERRGGGTKENGPFVYFNRVEERTSIY